MSLLKRFWKNTWFQDLAVLISISNRSDEMSVSPTSTTLCLPGYMFPHARINAPHHVVVVRVASLFTAKTIQNGTLPKMRSSTLYAQRPSVQRCVITHIVDSFKGSTWRMPDTAKSLLKAELSDWRLQERRAAHARRRILTDAVHRIALISADTVSGEGNGTQLPTSYTSSVGKFDLEDFSDSSA